MSADWYSFETAEKILTSFKSFAVVGCSSDPSRPSFGVARYLKASGFQVIPVNPSSTECQGMPCYPDLRSIPGGDIEVVDLFRRSEFVGAHVDEAIEVGAKAIWMQLGVVDEEAAQRATDAGLLVVMDRCPAIDHPRLVA
ncbi:MAG TPA: CoA-binding protein [Actinomycetota bacterium]|nr:CoA-binding protein [Actinomycetota bacterium]